MAGPDKTKDLRDYICPPLEVEAKYRDKALNPNNVIVQVRGVTKVYDLGKTQVHALRGVDLDVVAGEYLSVMGPSGSGKSTLFNMVGGLDKPTAGTVYFDNQDLGKLDAYEIAYLRCKNVAYVFQSFNLIPVMSALENVMLPMVFYGEPETNAEKEEKALAKLELVGLRDRADHRPMELSGGQQQRVAIARALANDPHVILADEPTGNLDLKTGEEIIDILKGLQQQHEVTIVTNTHDLKMIRESDRVVWLRDGAVDRVEYDSEIDISVGKIGDDETGGVEKRLIGEKD